MSPIRLTCQIALEIIDASVNNDIKKVTKPAILWLIAKGERSSLLACLASSRSWRSSSLSRSLNGR